MITIRTNTSTSRKPAAVAVSKAIKALADNTKGPGASKRIRDRKARDKAAQQERDRKFPVETPAEVEQKMPERMYPGIGEEPAKARPSRRADLAKREAAKAKLAALDNNAKVDLDKPRKPTPQVEHTGTLTGAMEILGKKRVQVGPDGAVYAEGCIVPGTQPDPEEQAQKKAAQRRAKVELAEKRKATGGNKGVGKRAAAEDAAKQGNLPSPPDFSADTHKPYRSRLAELVALALAGDIEGLRRYEIKTYSTSPKAMDRYRNLAVIALEARAAK